MKKIIRLLVSFLLIAVLAAGVLPLSSVSAESGGSAASITISGSKYVAKGKKITLTASQAVSWKSSNKKIATISSKGVVKGIKAGKVTITAVSKADKSIKKTWKITVMKNPVKKIKLKAKTTSLDLKKNKTVTIKATVSPSSAAAAVTWKSSNTKVAKVSSKGKVTAVGTGMTKITATAADGSKVKASLTVTVIRDLENPPTITVWCTDTGLAESLISEFQASREEYRDYVFRVEGHGEGEAFNDYLAAKTKPDLITFPQDQLARFLSLGTLSAVSTSSFAADCGSNAVSAVTIGSKAYGYPITSDNGFFLFYDKSVISDPGSMESILADCEAAGREFHMELSSGWYNAAFFFGAGCTIEYEVGSDGSFTGVTCDVGSAQGIKALKAMAAVAHSSAFVNNSVAGNMGENAAALVSGTWDAATVNELWGDNYAATKLPTVSGFQLSSFSGHKIIGICKANPDNVSVSKALAEYLSSTEAQIRRAEKYGWVPARKSAQKKVSLGLSARALIAQNEYAVPQKPLPGGYWDIAGNVGRTIMEEDPISSSRLSEIAADYESRLLSLLSY